MCWFSFTYLLYFDICSHRTYDQLNSMIFFYINERRFENFLFSCSGARRVECSSLVGNVNSCHVAVVLVLKDSYGPWEVLVFAESVLVSIPTPQ